MTTTPAPALVRVNGRKYSIQLLPPRKMPEALGLCYPTECRIELRDDQSLIEMKDTLLHELCHAVLHTQGREGHELEEYFVRALASGLIGIFQDNPGLAEWLATDHDK